MRPSFASEMASQWQAAVFVYIFLEYKAMNKITIPMSEHNRVYDNILQTIGRTPLIHLEKVGRELAPI